MNSTEFYTELVEVFNRQKRLSHYAPGRGVFVKAENSKWHQFHLSDYPISARDKIFRPRLTINRDWLESKITLAIAKLWNVPRDSKGLFSKTGLEITVMPHELLKLADSCPEIIHMIEAGSQEFITILPFEVTNITKTNLWSLSADFHAGNTANKNNMTGLPN